MTRCHVNAHTSKPRGQPFVRAFAPFDRAPRSRTQRKREVLDRGYIGRVAAPLLGREAGPHTRLPYQGLRLNPGHIGAPQLRNARTQFGVVAVAGIQQRYSSRKPDLMRPADLVERDLRFGLECDVLRHLALRRRASSSAQAFGKYSRYATGRLAS